MPCGAVSSPSRRAMAPHALRPADDHEVRSLPGNLVPPAELTFAWGWRAHGGHEVPVGHRHVERVVVAQRCRISHAVHEERDVVRGEQLRDGAGCGGRADQPGRPGAHQIDDFDMIVGWPFEYGYEFDVITDEDLHAEGVGVRRPYNVVLTGSYPEYYSEQILDGIHAYGSSISIRTAARRSKSARETVPTPGNANPASTISRSAAST